MRIRAAMKDDGFQPLTFHEALKHLVRIDPDSVGITSKRRKTRKRNRTNEPATNRSE